PVLARLPEGLVAAMARASVSAIHRLSRVRARLSPGLASFGTAGREVAAAALILVGGMQAIAQLRSLRQFHYRRPPGVAALGDTFRLDQGWQPFAPDPPIRSRITVLDALTADGRHIDPLTGRPPRHRVDGPLCYDGFPEHWLDFLSQQDKYPAFNQPLVEWARR